MFGSLGVSIREEISFQKLQNLWVINALMSSCILSEMLIFLNPLRTKSMQYFGLKFFGTVNRAVRF